MDINFQAGGEDKWSADIALVPVWQDEKILETCPDLAEAAPFLHIAPGMRDVTGKKGSLVIVYGHPDLPYSRVMFIGLGKDKSGSESAMDIIREGFAKACRRCREMGLKRAHIPYFCLDRLGDSMRVLEEAVYAVVLANHQDLRFKATTKDKATAGLDSFTIGFRDKYVPDMGRQAARRGERSAYTVIRARDLANAPGNHLYPEVFVEKAEELVRESKLKIEVFDREKLEELGFNAHLAVARGSAREPRLLILEHAPEGHEDEKPIIFVGKGITFDSGGISLKPSARMHLMKTDMTGAAGVLASLLTLADEDVPHRIIGVMALAENMPDGNATRPGDVVKGYSGDQIEIVNTDAEGRLVLADALAYATSRWEPRAVVDIATLTGACAVALGDEIAGLFCNDDNLAETLASAGKTAGENYWRLPLWESYADKLKSPIADIVHTGPREGGAVTAAVFLKHFLAKKMPWAHLDIAGVDWVDSNTPLCPKGATGFAARTLLELGRGGLA